MNSMLPSLSSAKGSEEFAALSRKAWNVMVIIAFGLIATSVIMADDLVRLLSRGADFAAAGYLIQIVFIGNFFHFFATLFHYFLISLEKAKTYLIASIVQGVVAVAFLLIFLQSSAGFVTAELAAWAIVIAQGIHMVGTALTVRYYHRIAIGWRTTGLTFLATLISSGLVWLAKPYLSELPVVLTLGFAFGGAVLVYVGFLFLTGALPRELITTIVRRLFAGEESKHDDPLRIAVDIRGISGECTGKEWYAKSLIEALAQIDHTNEYYLFTRYSIEHLNLPENFHIKTRKLPLTLWHLYFLRALRRCRIDILLAPSSYIAPSLLNPKRTKVITIIHDAVAFLFPKTHQRKATTIEKLTLKRALRHSSKVIAVSETTKQDIQRIFRLPEEKILVVPEAAREIFKTSRDIDQQKVLGEKYGISQKYLLFISTLEPRKNLVRLLQAYKLLSPALRDEYQLVIVGRKGWYYENIFKEVKGTEIESQVVFAGYAPDEDLPHLLHGAVGFVMPSLYEGFGLPPLEAFTCSTPVLISNTPAFQEVAGENGALYCDPYDVHDIHDKLVEFLTNEVLRKQLAHAGHKRSHEYNWEKTARGVLSVIEEII